MMCTRNVNKPNKQSLFNAQTGMVNYKFLVIIGLVALILGITFQQQLSSKHYSAFTQVYQKPRALPAFELTAHNGQQFSNQQLKGKWSFVFLGYLSCPDICPMTMAKFSKLLPSLQKASSLPVQVLFVSVDPQRDDVDAMAKYTNYFHQGITGLRAEHPHLFPFVRQLGLMYSVPEANVAHYTVDHSASVILINPQGHISAIFKPRAEVGKVPTIVPEYLLTDFKLIID